MRVINFFGGPGAGKSTCAAGLFFEMKKAWINVELVTEFAKELVWAGSSHMLSDQNFVFAQQEHRLNRLSGKVDVAITDSPLILSAYYAPEHYAASFKECVFDFFQGYQNINIFVRRSHAYSEVGRLQNQGEADAIASDMERFLRRRGIPYYALTANDANPGYLLHWLVHLGLVPLPDFIDHSRIEAPPPPGWIEPILINQLAGDEGEEDEPISRRVRTVGTPPPQEG